MGRKRKSRTDLPERVYFSHGAYYFATKTGWIWLGRSWPTAVKQYAKIISEPTPGRVSAIMDRYMSEWAPENKRPRTIENNKREIVPLKTAFGHMEPDEITSTDVYAYLDERPKIAGNREVALLSSVFKFAIRKGAAKSNPCKFVSRNKERPRDRHVTPEEYSAVYRASPEVIQCAMEIARQTGLRLGDILSLNERENVREGGIYVVTGKTGKKLLFEWTDELKALVERCKALRGKVRSMYLISTRDGQKYTTRGFAGNWRKVMRKSVNPELRFQFRDIRSVAADQSKHPTELLGHNDPRTTNRVYRRGPRKVTPNT